MIEHWGKLGKYKLSYIFLGKTTDNKIDKPKAPIMTPKEIREEM
jgi:hypothetical protein